jgi:basic membrane protein A
LPTSKQIFATSPTRKHSCKTVLCSKIEREKTMPDLTGYSLGRYHLTQQLGEGGMATVYKAFDMRLERDVAVKILRTEQFSPVQLEQVLQRFDREAKSLGKLSHSNIVSVLDYGEHESIPYLVMEYLPGGTLKQRLGAPLPWQEAVRVLLPVARALAYAHQRGIIHRDVKPANILLKESGEPILTDFGIAKLLEAVEGHTLTASGVGIGTPEYMAPEQGMGAKVDARVDIYALGTVFYELVTGRKPYIADTPMAVLLKHMTDPLPNPHLFVPDLPDEVEKVLIKAMAKQPDDRYETMTFLVAALEDLLLRETTAPFLSQTPGEVTTDIQLPGETAQASRPVEVNRLAPTPAAKPDRNWFWPVAAAAAGIFILAALVLGGMMIPRLLAVPVPSLPSPSPQPTVPEIIQRTAPTALVPPDCRTEQVFCVGLVTDLGKINDKSFNQSAWEGVRLAEKELGARVEFLETVNAQDYDREIAAFGDQGYDVIVTVGFALGEATARAAEIYPESRFIGVDQYPDTGKPGRANLVGLVFPEDQAGFLVGVLAAQMTKTGQVGAVLGPDFVPAVWRFGEGYRAGAKYARPNVEVSLVYHNDASNDKFFEDPDWGAAMANEMIAKGADVIFGAGGSTGNGAITTAARRNVYVIGVDTDQYFTLPEAAPRLLTSAIKDITPGVFELVRLARANAFPQGVFYAPAGYAPYHETESQIPEEVKAKMVEIREQLLTGQLKTNVPPQKP